MDTNRKYLIPQRLDDPARFLFVDMDVAMVAMVCFVGGMLCNLTITCSAIGIGLAWMYQKVKAGKHRAIGAHAIYWHLPFSFGFRRTPQSNVREFIG